MEGFVDALVSILEENKDISKSEAKSMRENFGNRSQDEFDIFILSEGLVSKAQLLKALSILYGVPSFDVIGYFFDTELLRNFPKDFLITNSIIPVLIDQDVLLVVAAEPDDYNLRSAIGDFANYAIEFRVGLKRDIIDAIREYYDESPIEDDIKAMEEPEGTGLEIERLE